MSPISAFFLGLVQGLSEFLPISSSGHLVLVQAFLSDFSQPGVLFETVLHLGTVLAIIIYFRRELVRLTRQYLLFLVFATLPVAVVGLMFQEFIEGLFSNLFLVGLAFLITALLNFLVDRFKTSQHKLDFSRSLVIGFFQAIALVPGISRSGSTIFAGVKQGINRAEAAKFSFLLSIPAVLGANALQFVTHGLNTTLNVEIYLVGFISSFVAGYLAIGLVLKLLLTKNFRVFGYYCLIIGILSLFLVI